MDWTIQFQSYDMKYIEATNWLRQEAKTESCSLSESYSSLIGSSKLEKQ